mmetsp:Transcript_31851/g.93171  ORF Transcript_31851/g.93171 Transcript_31851/m.93171 type:complete len:448 (-) Transcript_31851:839-2182(-)
MPKQQLGRRQVAQQRAAAWESPHLFVRPVRAHRQLAALGRHRFAVMRVLALSNALKPLRQAIRRQPGAASMTSTTLLLQPPTGSGLSGRSRLNLLTYLQLGLRGRSRVAMLWLPMSKTSAKVALKLPTGLGHSGRRRLHVLVHLQLGLLGLRRAATLCVPTSMTSTKVALQLPTCLAQSERRPLHLRTHLQQGLLGLSRAALLREQASTKTTVARQTPHWKANLSRLRRVALKPVLMRAAAGSAWVLSTQGPRGPLGPSGIWPPSLLPPALEHVAHPLPTRWQVWSAVGYCRRFPRRAPHAHCWASAAPPQRAAMPARADSQQVVLTQVWLPTERPPLLFVLSAPVGPHCTAPLRKQLLQAACVQRTCSRQRPLSWTARQGWTTATPAGRPSCGPAAVAPRPTPAPLPPRNPAILAASLGKATTPHKVCAVSPVLQLAKAGDDQRMA